jgi:hypothetical protein
VAAFVAHEAFDAPLVYVLENAQRWPR